MPSRKLWLEETELPFLVLSALLFSISLVWTVSFHVDQNTFFFIRVRHVVFRLFVAGT